MFPPLYAIIAGVYPIFEHTQNILLLVIFPDVYSPNYSYHWLSHIYHHGCSCYILLRWFFQCTPQKIPCKFTTNSRKKSGLDMASTAAPHSSGLGNPESPPCSCHESWKSGVHVHFSKKLGKMTSQLMAMFDYVHRGRWASKASNLRGDLIVRQTHLVNFHVNPLI